MLRAIPGHMRRVGGNDLGYVRTTLLGTTHRGPPGAIVSGLPWQSNGTSLDVGRFSRVAEGLEGHPWLAGVALSPASRGMRRPLCSSAAFFARCPAEDRAGRIRAGSRQVQRTSISLLAATAAVSSTRLFRGGDRALHTLRLSRGRRVVPPVSRRDSPFRSLLWNRRVSALPRAPGSGRKGATASSRRLGHGVPTRNAIAVLSTRCGRGRIDQRCARQPPVRFAPQWRLASRLQRPGARWFVCRPARKSDSQGDLRRSPHRQSLARAARSKPGGLPAMPAMAWPSCQRRQGIGHLAKAH